LETVLIAPLCQQNAFFLSMLNGTEIHTLGHSHPQIIPIIALAPYSLGNNFIVYKKAEKYQ